MRWSRSFVRSFLGKGKGISYRSLHDLVTVEAAWVRTEEETFDIYRLTVRALPFLVKCTPFLRFRQNPNRIFIFPMRSSETIKHSLITTAFIHFFHLINMSLQASAEANYATLEALMKALQNHVSTKDYIIVKACFKSNSFKNVIKVVLLCDRNE